MSPTLPIAILALLLGASTSAAQTISIDTLPAYGSLGFVTGTVAGVDPATHHVAVYIQIEGSGWWTKPTFPQPTVPIAPDGSFSADVGTGGPASLDSRATIFCAALLEAATTPPPAAGAVRIPAALAPLALDCEEHYARTLLFAGRSWAVKEAPSPVGPGQNFFSDRVEDVFVDAQGLHLRVDFSDGQWRATELILLDMLGYGLYVFETDSELDDLDANLTFGAFSWDAYGDDESGASLNREIDFEDSRWGDAADPTNAQTVIQPYDVPGNLRRYTLPDLALDAALTRFFAWSPQAVSFFAFTGSQDPLAFPYPPAAHLEDRLYLHDPAAGHFVPTAGRARLRFNLWFNDASAGASPPAGGQPVEIVITDFDYIPLPEPSTPLQLVPCLGLLALLARFRRSPRATPRHRVPGASGHPERE